MSVNDSDISKIYELLWNSNNDELKDLIDRLVSDRDYYKELAKIDSLTKLSNRRVLDDNLKYSVVVMCDIDDFKGINDKYGHELGDRVLIYIALKLKSIIGKDDIVCRYGGDEFTIVFKKDNALGVVDKLLIIKDEIINTKFNDQLSIGMSFGLAEYEKDKLFYTALEEADRALYESKTTGKNKVTIYVKK